MIYTIPPTTDEKIDLFVDDFILIFLDTEEKYEKEPLAIPLKIYLFSRPHDSNN